MQYLPACNELMLALCSNYILIAMLFDFIYSVIFSAIWHIYDGMNYLNYRHNHLFHVYLFISCFVSYRRSTLKGYAISVYDVDFENSINSN